jgi:hypothetical protein
MQQQLGFGLWGMGCDGILALYSTYNYCGVVCTTPTALPVCLPAAHHHPSLLASFGSFAWQMATTQTPHCMRTEMAQQAETMHGLNGIELNNICTN